MKKNYSFLPRLKISSIFFLLLILGASIVSSIPTYCCPSVKISLPNSVRKGDIFTVTLTYYHDYSGSEGEGGVHLHWLDSQADYISGGDYYDKKDEYEFVECSRMISSDSCSIKLKALVDSPIHLYYRAWDWSKDADCGGGRYDHHRSPRIGTCSPLCNSFPDDVIRCTSSHVATFICVDKIIIKPRCSLPGDICQEGDGIEIFVSGSSCPQPPKVKVELRGDECLMEWNLIAYDPYGGSACYFPCYTLLKLPTLPSKCLDKTVTLTASTEGISTSTTIKLSDDPTRDVPPSMRRRPTWSPSIILEEDEISYTAYAQDDKGLKEIRIILNDKLVKTCSVSGTSASCTYIGGPYSAGTELSFKGTAIDIKGQEPSYYNPGRRTLLLEVCYRASDTDGGENYLLRGNCTEAIGSEFGCRYHTMQDFCPWEGPRGYCCGILPGKYWHVEKILSNGTVVCCRRHSPKPIGGCVEREIVNCKNVVGEYSPEKEERECTLKFYDCSKLGKICSGGRCVPPTTPSDCNCTPWISIGCGLSPCSSTEMKQERNCTPSGCDIEERCIEHPLCGAPSTPPSPPFPVFPVENKRQIDLKPGWNMISQPFETFTADTNCKFSASIYGYDPENKRYYVVSSLNDTVGGYGYWVKVDSDCQITFSGDPVMKIHLKPGWNMIGTVNNEELPLDLLKERCKVLGDVYTYNTTTRKYEVVDMLYPGRGYWVRVMSSCVIYLKVVHPM